MPLAFDFDQMPDLDPPDPCPVCQRITDEQCGHALEHVGQLPVGTRIAFAYKDMYENKTTYHQGSISEPPIQHREVVSMRRLVYVELDNGNWQDHHYYVYLNSTTLVVSL